MNHVDPMGMVIFWVTLLFLCGVGGRYVAWRLHQPGVLGELLMGVLLGNVLYLFGEPTITLLREGGAVFHMVGELLANKPVVPSWPFLTTPQAPELIKVAYALDLLARFGILFLLFMVGLDSSITDLKQTGRSSLWVALIGVCLPLLLGLGVLCLFNHQSTWHTNLFVAATLTATSVGITASVLKELKKMRTREAHTILGAAMMDDILGLILLAVVSQLAVHQTLNGWMIVQQLLAIVVFFVGTLWLGPKLLKQSVRVFSFLPLWQTKLVVAFVFLMGFSWLATLVQLSSIIGAFVAGLILHDGLFTMRDAEARTQSLQTLIAPFEALLAPLFFMLIGIQVKLETLMQSEVLILALILTVVAIVGKLGSGWGARKQDDRLLIGIGMLPRGEVGIIFASIGHSLNVISDGLFSAIILMVFMTTLITPPWLKWRYRHHDAA